MNTNAISMAGCTFLRDVTGTRLVLLVLTFVSIVALACIGAFHDAIKGSATLSPEWKERVSQGATGVLTLIIGFTLARVIYVIRDDRDLVRLQSDFVTHSVERRKAKEEMERISKADEGAVFSSREGYGRRAEH